MSKSALEGPSSSEIDLQLEDSAEEIDREELLIESVRKREVLYDASHKDSKNAGRKQMEWLNVASEVKMDSAWCKAKWRYLRDTYVRKKKQLKGKSGDKAKKIQKWTHIITLEFLDKFAVQKKTSGNSLEMESEVADDGTLLDEEEDNRAPGENVFHRKPKQKKKNALDEESINDALLEYLKKPKDDFDSHHYFAMSIAEDLRGLSDLQAARVKLNIQQLILDARCENNNNSD